MTQLNKFLLAAIFLSCLLVMAPGQCPGAKGKNPSASHAKSKAAPAKPKFTPEEELQWHYNEGLRLKKLGQIDDAMAQWDECLRMKPGYKPAKQELDNIESAAVAKLDAVTKTDIPRIKEALKGFAVATSFRRFADVLTDDAANDIAIDLLDKERDAIMDVANKPPASLNASFFDDFENFLSANSLHGLLPQDFASQHDESNPAPMPRLRGRALLIELAQWAKRLFRSNIVMTMERPHRIKTLAERVDKLHYIVHTNEWVDIDGTECDDHVPLQARLEDGEWRIGPRDGWKFRYAVTALNHRYASADGSMSVGSY